MKSTHKIIEILISFNLTTTLIRAILTTFQDTALERATNTFKLLDVNGDGELNEDEFVAGCMQDKALADMLNAGHMM